jgi:hypothetical protein
MAMAMKERLRLMYPLGVLILSCVALAWSLQDAHEPPQKVNHAALSAPTFYLVIEAHGCSNHEIGVRGVSNLPAGAIIDLIVADFNGDGWKYYSDKVIATVGEDGHFKAMIHPKGDLTFRHNLLITAVFGTVYHHQPQNVMKIVGSHGEHLDDLNNPQAYTVSGFNTTLQTMARVPACGPQVD